MLFVDSLDDDPRDPRPGTFRWAATRDFPRTVIFRVGGTIDLETFVRIEQPDLTIAGHTAPGDGINFRSSPIVIQTHNVIVRGIRIRPGGDLTRGMRAQGRDALQIFNDSRDVIVDQVSLSWSLDELLHVSGPVAIPGESEFSPRRVTVQRTILGEALFDAGHPDGPHSKAILVSGGHVRRLTLLEVLSAHNDDRNPRMIWGADVELINNVFYNFGKSYAAILAGTNHPVEPAPIVANFIGNRWVRGPDTSMGPEIRVRDTVAPGTRVFLWDNVGFTRPPGTAPGEREDAPLTEPSVSADAPVAAESGIVALSSEEALERVLRCSGAWRRDAVDERIVESARTGGGRIIDSEDDYPLGYPTYASAAPPADGDEDGMADEWEEARGTDPAAADDAAHDLHPHYTNLEVYLHELMNEALPPECRNR